MGSTGRRSYEEDLMAWWHSMYWRWGVGESCLFYFPRWTVQASPRSLYKPEHERAILQMHVRKAVRNGWRPNSPQYFLMVARGGWNSLILRHNPLIRAKWRVPVLVPEISYETEKALLLRAGNCYRVVQNLRETEQVIYDYMQGDIKREE